MAKKIKTYRVIACHSGRGKAPTFKEDYSYREALKIKKQCSEMTPPDIQYHVEKWNPSFKKWEIRVF